MQKATQKYKKKMDELRILFNRKAFGVTFSPIDDSNDLYTVPSKSAKLKNLNQINTIIDALSRMTINWCMIGGKGMKSIIGMLMER